MTGAFIKWLMRDEQHDVFETLLAVTLNIIFLSLVALLLWPLGKTMMAVHLTWGYGFFWILIDATSLLLALFRKIFRVDMDTHFDAYLISSLLVSSFLQAGWSAFAAITVRSFTADASVWMALLLYVAGALSCYIAFIMVASVYQGHLYKYINLPLAFVSFAVFSVWPRAGRLLYGWLIDLCQTLAS